ncbi:unnamed protein product [Paramecium pentaurelia]|uniref:MORN repeat protein n=1 Tax=Paramecium pentaurelia TaxID=43138 RepID=A0A8S1WFT4_9CILI|nr:unnamed protein product [Paramecium pentaurelia]
MQTLHQTSYENEIQQMQQHNYFEQIVECLEYLMGNYYKTDNKVQLTKDGTLKYIKDGEIIRIDRIFDQTKELSILTNLEQIKHLVWDGEFNQKYQRIGKWRVFWKDQVFNAGGSYDENGRKEGRWIELFENFWENGQVTFSGEYKNNKRNGRWNFSFQDKTIGGGIYDENGEKTGLWIELDNGFSCLSQITYHGIYDNGIKQGQWITKFKGQEIGENLKLFIVENIMKAKDVNNGTSCLEKNSSGGGMYINGVQDGMWKEVNESFQNDCKIFFVGQFEYGKKIGRWNVIFLNTIIGGGDYDNQGMKTGRWIDLNNNFFSYSQLIFTGQYISGKRIEKWEILCRFDPQKEFESIGSGQYDQKGIKYDVWIEPIEHIWNLAQIIYQGQYQNNGQKFGRWDILYNEENSEKFQLIGGGCYDENGLKSGEWAEVDSKFSYSCQVIQKGQYLKGRKVERWNYHFWEKIIGGGLYNEDGQKNGQWIDLDENFSYIRQLVWVGVYNNGFRIGQFKECNLQ